MKILIVDDVGYMRLYQEQLLQQKGYITLSASSGIEAIKILKAGHNIDVVLTDLMMRDMDGIELLQECQKMERMDDHGIVNPPDFLLMTALRPGQNTQPGDIERLEEAKRMAFIDILFKPVDHDKLFEILDKIELKRDCNETHDLGELVKTVQETIDLITKHPNANSAAPALSKLLLSEVARLEQIPEHEPVSLPS